MTDASASRDTAAPVELPALTALRGLAALTVLFYHGSFLAFRFAGGESPGMWARGNLAVDLFFLLSGFVLTHVYGGRLGQGRGWGAVGKFLWARLCRIYPASLFTVGVFVLQYTIGRLVWPAGVSFKAQLTAALLLMQVPWLDDVVINSVSWSISAELYGYLLFPFLIPVICRMSARMAAALSFAVLAGVVVYHVVFSPLQPVVGCGALFRALPEFIAGVLAYRCYSEGLLRKLWEKDVTLIAVIAMVVVACLTGASDGMIVVFLLALLLAAVSNTGQMGRIIDVKPLRWLGEVSYSVYIFQLVPAMLLIGISGVLISHGLGGARFQFIVVVFALGAGVLVHRCVDVPVRAALRRLPDPATAIKAFYRNATTRLTAPVAVPGRDR